MPARILPSVIFMKPPRFEYRAPDSLDEAVALLAADPAAKPIAGGQSLIPVLAFRLATPSLLVGSAAAWPMLIRPQNCPVSP